MKKLLSGLLVLCVAVGVAVLPKLGLAYQGQYCHKDTCYTVEVALTPEAAQEAAFKHAGVKASDVRMKKCKLDREHGKMVYEVEFYVGNMEYEYDIDANSGAVLKFEKEYK